MGLGYAIPVILMPKFEPGVCFYCDLVFEKPRSNQRGLSDRNPTEDHVYPLGARLPSGLPNRNMKKGKVRACYGCNEIKGHRHPLTWLSMCPSEAGASRLAVLLIDLGEPEQVVQFALQRRERMA